jgi:hypothetical protein
MNIFCIDLQNTATSEIKRICKDFNLYEDVVLELKSQKIQKVWIDSVTNFLVAEQKGDKVKVCKDLSRQLLAIKPYTPKVEEVVLDLDAILEKISAKGISSLTIREKKFLENYN